MKGLFLILIIRIRIRIFSNLSALFIDYLVNKIIASSFFLSFSSSSLLRESLCFVYLTVSFISGEVGVCIFYDTRGGFSCLITPIYRLPVNEIFVIVFYSGRDASHPEI
jgi:hypothetical protein